MRKNFHSGGKSQPREINHSIELIAHVTMVYHGGISTCNKNGSFPFWMDTMGGNRVWWKKWMLKGLRGWNIINYMWFRKFAWKKWMHLRPAALSTFQWFGWLDLECYNVLQESWAGFECDSWAPHLLKMLEREHHAESYDGNHFSLLMGQNDELGNSGIFGCFVLIWRL